MSTPELTPRQAKIVKLKAKGMTSKQISKQVDVTPEHVRATLQKNTIKTALFKEMQKQGITLDKILAPIAKGLVAQVKKTIGEVTEDNGDGSKSVTYITEDTDNIPLQLQASDRASKLMGLYNDTGSTKDTNTMTLDDITALANASDEVELTRLLFKRNS
jgi:transcriptional regulator